MSKEFRREKVARSAREMLALYCLTKLRDRSRDDYIGVLNDVCGIESLAGHSDILAQLLNTYIRVTHAMGDRFRSNKTMRHPREPKRKGDRSSDDAIVLIVGEKPNVVATAVL